MENINLQEVWKQNEILLDNTRLLNVNLLKEVKLDKAKSSLKSLLYLPVSTGLFFIATASYALYFVFTHLESLYFAFSGVVVAFFSALLVFSSVIQLKQILSVDYNLPVTKLQKDIAKIKSSVITNLKIGAWVLPFSPFIGLFFFKVLFNFDLVTTLTFDKLVTLGFITVLLEILSLFILRALRPQNINKKWMNGLLKGSGSQVDEALEFLKQIEEFEKEENQ